MVEAREGEEWEVESMRIAVSADSDNGLDSAVNPHFGRCPLFVLVDVEKGSVVRVETVRNPYHKNHQPGQVPGFIRSQRADVILSGGIGASALSFFDQSRVEVATGASGTVGEAVDRYLAGTLRGIEQLCPEELGNCG